MRRDELHSHQNRKTEIDTFESNLLKPSIHKWVSVVWLSSHAIKLINSFCQNKKNKKSMDSVAPSFYSAAGCNH